jgi:hypothetical protein
MQNFARQPQIIRYLWSPNRKIKQSTRDRNADIKQKRISLTKPARMWNVFPHVISEHSHLKISHRYVVINYASKLRRTELLWPQEAKRSPDRRTRCQGKMAAAERILAWHNRQESRDTNCTWPCDVMITWRINVTRGCTKRGGGGKRPTTLQLEAKTEHGGASDFSFLSNTCLFCFGDSKRGETEL